jgi:hypothetical protein
MQRLGVMLKTILCNKAPLIEKNLKDFTFVVLHN